MYDYPVVRMGMFLKTKGKVNDLELLKTVARRAGERAILKHRLAGISVTGILKDSSLIISHEIEYQALSHKARYRESMNYPAKINEKHNQRVLSEIVDVADRNILLNSGWIAYSRSNGYLLTHTFSAKSI